MEIHPSPVSCALHIDFLRAEINTGLKGLVTKTRPALLYEPVHYVIAGKGKRIRPLLVLLAAEAFGAPPAAALPGALSVEVFHNFTLVHDDIMDHAETRRGRPTIHTRWDESTAILSGDYLMGLSYALLGRLETNRLATVLQRFTHMMTALCEGQTWDKAFEQQEDVNVDEYLEMIDAKTGALLACALEIGGLMGTAGERDLITLREIGHHIGRAFQIQDDLLDLTAKDSRWGKVVGGDLIEGKKTFLLLRTLERAEGEEQRWFRRIIQQKGLPASEVDAARERMDRLGVLEETANTVQQYSEKALTALEQLPAGMARESLRWLVESMRARLH